MSLSALLQYLKKIDKPLERTSYNTTEAELIIRVPAAASASERYIRKTVGDETITSRIGKKQRHQNAALDHVCTGGLVSISSFTSASHQLGNMCTLKLASSCNFKQT